VKLLTMEVLRKKPPLMGAALYSSRDLCSVMHCAAPAALPGGTRATVFDRENRPPAGRP
jgi:hypothetical protein